MTYYWVLSSGKELVFEVITESHILSFQKNDLIASMETIYKLWKMLFISS